MRKRYIQHPETFELIDADEYVEPSSLNTPMIMPDIKEYTSMIDGTRITSRSQHRDHLRRHGCIEIGNETKHLFEQSKKRSGPPPGLKDALIREFQKRGI